MPGNGLNMAGSDDAPGAVDYRSRANNRKAPEGWISGALEYGSASWARTSDKRINSPISHIQLVN